MDTLELLRTFSAVAARASFSVAAKDLDVSRANVSKNVAQLEDRLGTRLLNRSTRTVSLTDAGSFLLARSAPLIEMMDLTRDELKQRSSTPSGRVRMTAPRGLGSAHLPSMLADFMQLYPEVGISLHLDNRSVDLVEEGIDVALRVGRITDANFIVRKLRRIDMVVCATPGYWRKNGEPRRPADLVSHDALTYSLRGPNPVWQFKVNGEVQGVRMRSRMDSNDAAPLLQMALQGLGVVCLPLILVKTLIDAGELQAVLPGFGTDDAWLYAAYSQRRHNSAALKALLEFLEKRWLEA